MTSRKKGKVIGLPQLDTFSDPQIPKTFDFHLKKQKKTPSHRFYQFIH